MAVTTEEAQAVQSVYVNRKYLYGKQSDKYMIQYQLGRITKEEWEAKRQEVKDMLPYPSGIDKKEALDKIVSLTGWTYE
jgi:hypothetical protein|tara:strand:- start:131 stop:367 length:237 start_codon:yes stop_codon:yes gene_type:complete